jgi:hypothetical protein
MERRNYECVTISSMAAAKKKGGGAGRGVKGGDGVTYGAQVLTFERGLCIFGGFDSPACLLAFIYLPTYPLTYPPTHHATPVTVSRPLCIYSGVEARRGVRSAALWRRLLFLLFAGARGWVSG